MAKNRDASKSFPIGSVCLLLDTSSIVRIRNFEETIPLYAKFFDLYTLAVNKKELEKLTANEQKGSQALEFSIELIRQIQLGNITALRTGAPYVNMPKAFDRMLERHFPSNNLSLADKMLLFFANSAKENTALVTNDQELKECATALGITAFGAFDLHLMMQEIDARPQKLADIYPALERAKEIIEKLNPSC